ncbi:hypothetical protein [Chitinophaga nivalis]|uniref:MotA/TolQ/ExbB proton channel domain-containing protein n=1 Tax=Chitinophaga nivalis TaxID=2991709 RepID=A0ABT3IU11_9BACT|nr:hypothetical protein [Chitinophaga nivalis]MCW3462924.1 hypothetical protein [Chitinophaga nivalis]MCW3487386.1 hypothetical protein [Chitinophaga nivalis]
MGLSTVLFIGANTVLLLSFMSWGACFIHSVLSLYLQRSLLMPDMPLKENTPGGIRIMGTIVMAFALVMLFGGLACVAATPEMIAEAAKEMPTDQQTIIQGPIIKTIGVICLLTGILLILNATLSFRFLRQWQQNKEGRDQDQH